MPAKSNNNETLLMLAYLQVLAAIQEQSPQLVFQSYQFAIFILDQIAEQRQLILPEKLFKIKVLREQGDLYLEKREIENAMSLFNLALSLITEDLILAIEDPWMENQLRSFQIEMLTERAMYQFKKAHFEQALLTFEHASTLFVQCQASLDKTSRAKLIYSRRVEVYLHLNRLPEALTDIEKSLAILPKEYLNVRAFLLYVKAIIYATQAADFFNSENYSDCLRDIEVALQSLPDTEKYQSVKGEFLELQARAALLMANNISSLRL